MARHIYTYVHPTSPKDLAAACRALENDGVIAYPTDVNWALGCDPASKKALDKIRLLKPYHPKEQPFSLMCDSLGMVSTVAHIENFAYRLIKKALPGRYTFILNRTHDLPRQIEDKRKNVGVRVPDSPLLLDLIKAFGKPIATTSLQATTPDQDIGEKPLTFGYEIDAAFGHGLDIILDLGEELLPDETTIIDFSDGRIEVVREGRGCLKNFESFIDEN